MAEILIGTSGYSFQDWRGPFYPENIPDGQMLPFYTEHFRATEVNATYYRILPPAVFRRMAERTPPEFQFIVKVHADVTHARKDPDPSMMELTEALQPLIDEDKLFGLLAQFPYSFKNRFESRKYLIHLAELTSTGPLFVEFRHASWAIPPLYDFLGQHGIGYVNVDEPELPNLLPRQVVNTTDIGYVRFHGRNKEAWWDKNKGDRYDYNYSKGELEEWKRDIDGILDRIKRIYLFFNNCYHGQAAQNALDMQELFAIS